ncbi:MAG: hypothetical protein LUQ20_02000 [Candidatus Methanoperedens sp.]|nr:hypothetical protein [Candidatus Methanoperedens sp.]
MFSVMDPAQVKKYLEFLDDSIKRLELEMGDFRREKSITANLDYDLCKTEKKELESCREVFIKILNKEEVSWRRVY